MLLGTYYLILALIGLLCWDLTYASTEHRAVRIFWRALGIVIVTLPIFLPLKTAFYYGLLYNSTVFSWSADTWTHGTDPRRGRSILGAGVLAFVPLFWNWPLEEWLGVVLVPTVGLLIVGGLSYGVALSRGR